MLVAMAMAGWVAMSAPSPPHSNRCELNAEATVGGRPLEAWFADLRSPDHVVVLAARETMRREAGLVLSIVVAQEAAGRGQHDTDLPRIFLGVGSAVPALTSKLACENWRARYAAIELLGWLGAAAAPAIPVILAALEDPVAGVRGQAAWTLRSIDAPRPEVVAGLRRHLGDREGHVADAAATALSHWPEAALPALDAALFDPDVAVRRHAVRALGMMKGCGRPALPSLLSVLEHDVLEVQLEVLDALGRWSPAEIESAAPLLLRFLAEPPLGCPAARLLARLKVDEAIRALPVLIAAMRQEPDPRMFNCEAQVGEDVARLGPAAIPSLVGLSRSRELWTRRAAVSALGQILPQTGASLAAIADALGDDDLGGLAGQVLGELGGTAVPVLVTALDSESAGARKQAALTLGRLGENARAAGAKLAERLELDLGEVKSAVLFALGRIGGPDAGRALPALRRALENQDLRPVAAEALARIAGADAVDVAPILIEAVRAQSAGACPHPTAHEALRAIGPAAVPAIVAALTEPEAGGDFWLFGVLDHLGREALEAARPILLSRLDTPGSDVEAAKRLLRLDGTPSAKLIEIFSRGLALSNPWRRLEGAEGLVNAGPDHRARAEQVLVELLGHEYEEVRTRAAAARKRIRDARP